MTTKKINIGTSGWHYEHWREHFYPGKLRTSDWLTYYGECFNSVEINGSFYKLPSKKTFKQWKKQTPGDFVFTIKASRYITHMKKLKDPGEPVKKFFDGIETIEEKMGAVVFQLPPKWNCNTDRLAGFLKALPGGHRYAFEFRDPSWITGEVNDILADSGAAFCIYDYAGFKSPRTLTADFAYVRLHGPHTDPYTGSYGKKELEKWRDRIIEWKNAGIDVFLYFDNDQAGHAVENAGRLKAMIKEAH